MFGPLPHPFGRNLHGTCSASSQARPLVTNWDRKPRNTSGRPSLGFVLAVVEKSVNGRADGLKYTDPLKHLHEGRTSKAAAGGCGPSACLRPEAAGRTK